MVVRYFEMFFFLIKNNFQNEYQKRNSFTCANLSNYQMYNLNSISRIDSTDKINLDKNEDNLPFENISNNYVHSSNIDDGGVYKGP